MPRHFVKKSPPVPRVAELSHSLRLAHERIDTLSARLMELESKQARDEMESDRRTDKITEELGQKLADHVQRLEGVVHAVGRKSPGDYAGRSTGLHREVETLDRQVHARLDGHWAAIEALRRPWWRRLATWAKGRNG